MTLRRLLCAVRGHQPGDRLYRYRYLDPGESTQWPGRAYTVADVGFRCKRCGKRVTS